MPVKEIIQLNKSVLRIYLGSFVNDLLRQINCPECREEIIGYWKEAITNNETIY